MSRLISKFSRIEDLLQDIISGVPYGENERRGKRPQTKLLQMKKHVSWLSSPLPLVCRDLSLPNTQSWACWFLTINVPVVYMAWDVMIFMMENPVRGPLEGVGPEIKTFWGPEMAMSEASTIWAQKSRDFQGPPLPMAWVMDFPASQSKIKNRYIGHFLFMSFCGAHGNFPLLWALLNLFRRRSRP